MGITIPPTISPGRSIDATGRALPMTDEAIRARAVEIARDLDALDDMGNEEVQRYVARRRSPREIRSKDHQQR